MASYKPHLISDFRAGLRTDLDPWLTPADAFPVLTDAILENGVVRQRKGFTAFADTGAGRPITAVLHHVKDDGSRQMLVADTTRLFRYSPAGGELTAVDAADAWTGGGRNLISWVNWKGRVFMANGKDPLRSYNGALADWVTVDLTGAGLNELSSCAFVEVNKERLILFRTTENGVRHPARARWCAVGNPDDFSGDEYVDAPTAEWIRGVMRLGDDILVFFDESVWWLKYTGDPALPFRWELMDSGAGSAAPFSLMNLGNRVMALSRAGLVVTDGGTVSRVDMKIPHAVLSISRNYTEKAFGAVIPESRQAWLLFPEGEAESPDRALVYSQDDAAFAMFRISASCVGMRYAGDAAMAWSAATGAWGSWMGSWVDSLGRVGFPVALAGREDGTVVRLVSGNDDLGEPVRMEVSSGQWNPYKSQGASTRMGRLDLLLETDGETALSVDFYMGGSETPYLARTVTVNTNGAKKWVRLFSGAVADFHRVRIRHETPGRAIGIHAVMPWFAPAGRVQPA